MKAIDVALLVLALALALVLVSHPSLSQLRDRIHSPSPSAPEYLSTAMTVPVPLSEALKRVLWPEHGPGFM